MRLRSQLVAATGHVPQPAFWRILLDRTVASAALIVLSPLFLLIGICILIDSGAPVLFVQRRVGQAGTLFGLIKFRTMRSASKGPSITVGGDARVTRVGKVLRKFKLDELPQLWNVVRGDMALVGPRPEVPEFVDLKTPLWQSILSVRPGITHPASIAFRDEEKLLARESDPVRYYRETLLPAKLAMSLAYLRQSSFRSDVCVLARTALCAVTPGHSDPASRLPVSGSSK